MSNYVEYDGSVAFHPGYYLNELVEDSGLTQEDFARRLATTPKNLSLLIRGKQRLSVDMAVKLSRMIGTSANYWLNLQNEYDIMLANMAAKAELKDELEVLRLLGYNYFRDSFGLPDLPRQLEEQVKCVRGFLGVASLKALRNRDWAVSFRESREGMSESNIVKANAMVQIAVNEALQTKAPKFNRSKFVKAVDYATTQTKNHAGFYPLVRQAFLDAGVILVILPNLAGSKINGATKKIGSSVMLMVNDRRQYADSFWFTLLHEAGHVLHGDYGVSFKGDVGEKEIAADRFARDKLIGPVDYSNFVGRGIFTKESVLEFANAIDRDPGIVVGRLQNDGLVKHSDVRFQPLMHKYKVSTGVNGE